MQKTQQILLVVNPISANRDKSEIIKNIKLSAEVQEKEVIIFETNGENDKERLIKIISEVTPSRVVLVGGDGTIKLVAESIDNSEIPIGIIPGGSANGLAVNLDISQDSKEAINTALGNNFITMDSIEIEGELCLHMSDFGLNAALIKNYESSNLRGKIGYLVQSLPTLFTSKYPYKFTITFDGKSHSQEGVLLAFANAQMYGTGANVNPNGRLNDGFFEIIIFKSLNPLEILKALRNEVDVNSDFVKIFSVKEAQISCKNDVPFQIDGEYRGEKQNLSVRISNKTFKIAVPPNFSKS